MSIVLYHHPFTRAASVVWMLEEVRVPYELRFVDLMKGDHKQPDVTTLNPMGKLPLLTDDDTVVTETAAIGLYLADRYAPGRLAPALGDPSRGTYLRWSLFAPSVIEPGVTAKAQAWEFKPSSVGWGDHDTMIRTMERALEGRDFVLGSTFSMADIIFGSTLQSMLRFKLLASTPLFAAYVERLQARPALQRADARNARSAREHNLDHG